MKKKALSLILATAMAVSVCACGSTEDQSSAGNESNTKVESSDAESTTASTPTVDKTPEEYVPTYPISEEPITITGMVVGKNPNSEGEMTRLLWDTIEEYTNIRVEWVNLESPEAVATYLAGLH